MKVREILKIIRADGWKKVKTKGSHRHFKHRSKPGKVTVSGHPSDDLLDKTESSILTQAGLKK
ncbi:MAG: type II toxin-antitoxin system HicA family toxin [Alphaproteobacteria bacterium]|nr:type II toxin-antitoxin system HicA family toxin [Alphaproteobacteria bacterium]MDA8030084.1 type II toxin-antitoxin system HicA family toxin [Alphaproteobacteria bacterium]